MSHRKSLAKLEQTPGLLVLRLGLSPRVLPPKDGGGVDRVWGGAHLGEEGLVEGGTWDKKGNHEGKCGLPCHPQIQLFERSRHSRWLRNSTGCSSPSSGPSSLRTGFGGDSTALGETQQTVQGSREDYLACPLDLFIYSNCYYQGFNYLEISMFYIWLRKFPITLLISDIFLSNTLFFLESELYDRFVRVHPFPLGILIGIAWNWAINWGRILTLQSFSAGLWSVSLYFGLLPA